ARATSGRWQWTEPTPAVSGDGDSSSHALPGIRRVYGSFCLCIGRADHAVPGREVDSHHPPLDHGDLGLSDNRNLPGRALGLLGAWLGRILGMGPRRECLADALVDRHSFLALGHDAGEARHAEDL